jgi:outer membrane protein assembly factor BamB
MTYEYSNVAVDAQAVYVGDNIRQSHSLLALDKRTGRQLWAAPVDGTPGSSVAAHDRVCTHTRENKIFCVTADGRTKLLDYQLSGQVEQTQMVMTDQTLFVSDDNALYALRFSSTPLAWKQSIREGSLSAASLIDGGKKLVVQTRTALHAYDAGTGNPLWLVSSPQEDGAWSRAAKLPIELGGAVIGWGDSFAFGVSPEGRLLWQLAVEGSISAAPVSVGNDMLVLAVHGHKQELIATSPRKLFD